MSKSAVRLECEVHFNEPALMGTELVRLIGYGETAIDCYYIVRRMDGSMLWHTGVGGVYPLGALRGQRGGGEWDDLRRIDNDLTRDGAPPEPTMIIDIRPDDEEHHQR